MSLRFGEAIDLYIGDLARRSRRPSTREAYRRNLNNFAALVKDKDADELLLRDYERFLDRWTDGSPSTLASGVSLVRGFSYFLFERGYTASHVAEPLKRPTRLRAEDLAVVTVSREDVGRLIDACVTWQETLCIATAVYCGARRGALASVRLRDVDLTEGTVTFVEKGGKRIRKPLPSEYLALLREAEQHGIWAGQDDYLIPNRRPNAVRRKERSDKVIWDTVKLVASRAGVTSHVHALRAAFAVQFDAAHPGHVIALKELLGHSRIETTLIYLRRKDKSAAMEAVRDLSWSSPGFPESQGKAHTGFEPVPPP
jgi:integrase/recombinase XerD